MSVFTYAVHPGFWGDAALVFIGLCIAAVVGGVVRGLERIMGIDVPKTSKRRFARGRDKRSPGRAATGPNRTALVQDREPGTRTLILGERPGEHTGLHDEAGHTDKRIGGYRG